MRLSFHKKKQPASQDINATQERIARNFVGACIRLQERWAKLMQKQTDRLSRDGKLIVLLLFCFVSGSLSSYLIVVSLMGHSSGAIKLSNIKATLSPRNLAEEKGNSKIIISKEEFLRIEYVKHYLDSLAKSISGRLLYDSILKVRPGLPDSLSFIENIYQSQPKQ